MPPANLQILWSPLKLQGLSGNFRAFGRDARLSLDVHAESYEDPFLTAEHVMRTRTLLWVLSVTGTNGRSIRHETRAVELVRETFEPRGWRVVTLNTSLPAGGAEAYQREARAIAGADILVSLFGSALHSCRLMRPGSLVVEIHAALKSDFDTSSDHMYDKLCTGAGLRWVGYAPLSPFRPVVNDGVALGEDGLLAKPPRMKQTNVVPWWHWQLIDGISTERVAHVLWPDESDFRAFLGQLSRGEWANLAESYERRTRARRDPRVLWRAPRPASARRGL